MAITIISFPCYIIINPALCSQGKDLFNLRSNLQTWWLFLLFFDLAAHRCYSCCLNLLDVAYTQHFVKTSHPFYSY